MLRRAPLELTDHSSLNVPDWFADLSLQSGSSIEVAFHFEPDCSDKAGFAKIRLCPVEQGPEHSRHTLRMSVSLKKVDSLKPPIEGFIHILKIGVCCRTHIPFSFWK